jgi:NAD-dependent DNA ligase
MHSINLLSRRFLVWSYLYYQLDESLVSDNEYDKLCIELKNEKDYYYAKEIIEKHFSQEEASGYSIKRKEYPSEIVSTALHLLYQSKYTKNISFEKFLSMHGYKIEHA